MNGRKHRKLHAGMLGVVLIVSVAPQIEAAQYYVSPAGTADGDGSKERPFSAARVAQAVPLRPGDEVIFRDGVYSSAALGGPLTIASVGNEKGPVTWRAENRHQAIIDGGRAVGGWQPVAGENGVWETYAQAFGWRKSGRGRKRISRGLLQEVASRRHNMSGTNGTSSRSD